MVYASQLRSGMAIRYEGQVYKVLAADYHPGQGKMGGVTHARLKNLSTGTLWEQSFRSDLKLEDLAIEKQAMEFLYSDAENCHFMNPETYDQVDIPVAVIGSQSRFLQAEMRLGVEFVQGQPISVDFPGIVEIRVTDTAPPTHQQQDNTLKSARLENGIEVMVPQFIKVGDSIRLNVESLKYVERAKGSAK
ncbi:MAG: translation elongation factor P [Acidobacteria bacterium]|nr:MAG: translation elongation factor P [Acidobacteriota bacterium]